MSEGSELEKYIEHYVEHGPYEVKTAGVGCRVCKEDGIRLGAKVTVRWFLERAREMAELVVAPDGCNIPSIYVVPLSVLESLCGEGGK